MNTAGSIVVVNASINTPDTDSAHDFSTCTDAQLASYRQTFRAEQLRNERLAYRAHVAGDNEAHEMHTETALEHAEHLDQVVAEIDRRSELN